MIAPGTCPERRQGKGCVYFARNLLSLRLLTLVVHDILGTCLYIDDLSAALAFYTKVLGLNLTSKTVGRYLFFRCSRPRSRRILNSGKACSASRFGFELGSTFRVSMFSLTIFLLVSPSHL